MSGFTKLFSSILTSTIWCEPDNVRIVWITMLALADQRGNVDGTVPGLAAMARVPVQATREAIAKLEAPDPDSRTKLWEGRRIATIEGGWQILNHGQYRNTLNSDERREYLRKKQQEHREKVKSLKTNKVVNKTSTNVNKCQPLSTEAEAEVISTTQLALVTQERESSLCERQFQL